LKQLEQPLPFRQPLKLELSLLFGNLAGLKGGIWAIAIPVSHDF